MVHIKNTTLLVVPKGAQSFSFGHAQS